MNARVNVRLNPRVKPRATPRLRRLEDRHVETLVARVFGREDGPVFDAGTVPPALLEAFTQSDEVRTATWNFAVEVMQLWTDQYPGRAMLRPADRKTAALPPETMKTSDHNADGNTGGSPADPSSAAPAYPPADRPSDLSAKPSAPLGSAPLHPSVRPGAIPSTSAPAPTVPTETKGTFSAPNAKSGEPYRAVIDARDDQGRPVTVADARVPPEVGLAFDPATRELHGTPAQAGDHPINIRWLDDRGASRTGTLLLIVNANPRDLWKNIDVDPSVPYFKPNEDAKRVDAGPHRIAAGSKRGRSHAHAGTCRDDDFFIAHDAGSGWSVLIVADGAGSAKSSRKGAALAVEKAGGHVLAEVSGDEGVHLAQAANAAKLEPSTATRPLKDKLYQLFGKAAWAALRAIEHEAETQSAPVKDYSTTLLCAVHRETDAGHFVASFWLGDGAICAYGPPGIAKLMGKPDSGEFAGQTRFLDKASLSDSAAVWNRIEFAHAEALTALILMTDGISDPRFETDNGLADATKWDALWTEIAPALAATEPDQALVAWMDFFTPGHHDDRTIALLW